MRPSRHAGTAAARCGAACLPAWCGPVCKGSHFFAVGQRWAPAAARHLTFANITGRTVGPPRPLFVNIVRPLPPMAAIPVPAPARAGFAKRAPRACRLCHTGLRRGPFGVEAGAVSQAAGGAWRGAVCRGKHNLPPRGRAAAAGPRRQGNAAGWARSRKCGASRKKVGESGAVWRKMCIFAETKAACPSVCDSWET